MIAASRGAARCLEMLVVAGADLEQANPRHMTALMLAANNGWVDCVRVLINARVDLEARDHEGWTAAMFAGASGRLGCMEALAQAGADLAAKDIKKRTAAHYARDMGCEKAAAMVEEAVVAQRARREARAGPGRQQGQKRSRQEVGSHLRTVAPRSRLDSVSRDVVRRRPRRRRRKGEADGFCKRGTWGGSVPKV